VGSGALDQQIIQDDVKKNIGAHTIQHDMLQHIEAVGEVVGPCMCEMQAVCKMASVYKAAILARWMCTGRLMGIVGARSRSRILYERLRATRVCCSGMCEARTQMQDAHRAGGCCDGVHSTKLWFNASYV
jgi:hypothetical protein